VKELSSKQKGMAFLFVVLAVLGLNVVLRAINPPEPVQPVPVVAKAPTPVKNIGERVYSDRLLAYNKVEGTILLSFEIKQGTLDSIESDIRTLMRTLTKSDEAWVEVVVSAFGKINDDYGAKKDVMVYTISFRREEALKVVDWSKANLKAVGNIHYTIF
jgi:hypothetical protein